MFSSWRKMSCSGKEEEADGDTFSRAGHFLQSRTSEELSTEGSGPGHEGWAFVEGTARQTEEAKAQSTA